MKRLGFLAILIPFFLLGCSSSGSLDFSPLQTNAPSSNGSNSPAPSEKTVSTFSGSAPQFTSPTAVAVDSVGNNYVIDQSGGAIYKISVIDHSISIFAGTPGLLGVSDGVGSAARFLFPSALTIDKADNMYVLDSGSLRLITPDQTVSTLFTAAYMSGMGINSPAGIAASYNSPHSTVYIVDNEYINPGYQVTIWSTSVNPGMLAAQTPVIVLNPGTTNLGYANAITVDQSGNNLFVTGTDNSVSAIQTLWRISNLIVAPLVNTVATGFFYPRGVAVDINLNAYVSDANNNTIWMIGGVHAQVIAGGASLLVPANIYTNVVIFMGSHYSPTPNQMGYLNGSPATSQFYSPQGIAYSPVTGSIFVADWGNNSIREISNSGSKASPLFSAIKNPSNPSYQATFTAPQSLSIDSKGYTFVIDNTNNSTLWIISPSGIASIFANTISDSSIQCLNGVTVDDNDNLYVINSCANDIVSLNRNSDGSFKNARFLNLKDVFNNQPNGLPAYPSSLIFDHTTQSLYTLCRGTYDIALKNYANALVFKINPTAKTALLIAGKPGGVGYADGDPTTSLFDTPQAITVDSTGNLYIADTGNGLIRKITFSGLTTIVSTFAGVPNGIPNYWGQNYPLADHFNNSQGIAVDPISGNIYVADTGTNTIRMITPAGVVNIVAGTEMLGSANGPLNFATFNQPSGLAFDRTGNLFIADHGNNLVLEIH